MAHGEWQMKMRMRITLRHKIASMAWGITALEISPVPIVPLPRSSRPIYNSLADMSTLPKVSFDLPKCETVARLFHYALTKGNILKLAAEKKRMSLACRKIYSLAGS